MLAWRLPERSGGVRQAALRELHGRLVVQRRMRPLVVVPLAMLLAKHFGLQRRDEGFAAQELVPKAAVKALAIRILPRTAGLDVERLEPAPCDPVLHRQGHEFGAVVAADKLRRAPARED